MNDRTTFIKRKAKELEEHTIQIRTHLHEYPEFSSQEYGTVKYLKERIIKLGLEIEDVSNSTGFTALFDTGKRGETLGIRADLDALPIEEHPNNLVSLRKVMYKNEGVMHACGHMAIVLSTMEILTEMRDELTGKVYFIFEEGEEIGAAHVLTGLTNVWAKQLDITKTVTLGITQIHGESANNVIPEKVDIGGSLRFYDVEEGKRAIEIVKKTADLTAQAHNFTVTFSENFKVVAYPFINDEQLAEIAIRGNEEIKPGSVIHDVNGFASEIFNQYAIIAPTLFAFIGTRNEAAGSGAEHHNEQFDIDEDAFIYEVQATTKFAVDYLMS